MSMLTFAIGDIHGMYEKLKLALLEIYKRSPEPCRIVFLGDYCDRGPDTKQVFEVLMSGPQRANDEWEILMGNHEQMLVDAQDGLAQSWFHNGGAETLRSYGNNRIPEEVVEWCRQLPVKFETPYHFFVHAGIDPGISLDRQNQASMLWIRNRFLDSDLDHGKHVVHGHTPHRYPTLLPNRTNLDTAACFGNKLTVGVFDTSKPGPCIETF